MKAGCVCIRLFTSIDVRCNFVAECGVKEERSFEITEMKKLPKPQMINAIDVTALAAVLFVIVVIFFIYQATVTVHTHGSSVDLVSALTARNAPKADREDAMRIAITRDGKIYFRSDRISREMLRDMIRSAVSEGSEKRVYISVDKRIQYGVVDDVLTDVRSAGIEQITFLTRLPISPTTY